MIWQPVLKAKQADRKKPLPLIELIASQFSSALLQGCLNVTNEEREETQLSNKL